MTQKSRTSFMNDPLDSFTNLVFMNPPIFPPKFAVCLYLLQAYFCLRIMNIIQKKSISMYFYPKNEKPDEKYKIRETV